MHVQRDLLYIANCAAPIINIFVVFYVYYMCKIWCI